VDFYFLLFARRNVILFTLVLYSHTHLLYLAARRLDQHETQYKQKNIIVQRN